MVKTINDKGSIIKIDIRPFGFGSFIKHFLFYHFTIESGKNIQQPNESLVSREEFKERIRSIHQLASNALKGAPRDVWFCRKHDTSVCKSNKVFTNSFQIDPTNS